MLGYLVQPSGSGPFPSVHNNSTPRYDEAAAKLAWERTVAFFREHLA
jgi:hypothetical protein